MKNSFLTLMSILSPEVPHSTHLRVRLKPIGFFSRLLSAWLAVLLLIPQPFMILRLMADDAPPVVPVPLASVATDQPDYAPGTTAGISGRAFQPGENVIVQVVHADGTPSSGDDHQPWTVVADGLGNFFTTWHVCEDDCLNEDLEVRASGETSRKTASVIFHDGPGLPVAVADKYNTYASSGPNTIIVLANDYDPDGDPLTVVAVSTAAHGATAIPAGGDSVTFTPAAGYVGTDSFTYTIQDTSGNNSTAAVTVTVVASGHPFVWGRNYESQLGVPSQISILNPTPVASGFVTIVGGPNHSVAIKNDGTLWTWGYNGDGQLGHGDFVQRTSPTQVGAATDWTAIAAGGSHTIAIKSDGTLWTWGYNGYGQLGHGDFTRRTSPTKVGTATDWTFIAAGYYHTIAIKSDGTLWTWGYNGNGQLGHGDVTQRTSPAQVGTAIGWASASASYYHTVALRTDGTLWTWGYNGYGQLGHGDLTQRTSPAKVGVATDWAAVDAGPYHSVALKTGGTLWTWGNNGNGQLGHGDFVQRTSPTQVGTATGWTAIGAANNHTLALKNDATLWTWGYNGNGELGQGDTTQRSSPTKVGTASDWAAISGGVNHNLALKSDATLWTWGYNGNGQAGIDPVTRLAVAIPVLDLTDVAEIKGGYDFSVALRNDGTLWTWGQNWAGQLGSGDAVPRYSPAQVGTASDWAAVDAGTHHVVALKTDGTLWTWGYNGYGQLGHGDTAYRYSPTKVGAATWMAIAARSYHTLGVKNDGTLWSWGANWNGQLGQGDTVDRYSPVKVGTAINWKTIASGYAHSLATKTDNTLWSWGANWYGQLGHGDTGDRYLPTQVGTMTGWSTFAGGESHTIALKSDGTLWTWGRNYEGELALGDTALRYSPTKVGTATDWSAIAVGIIHTLALKTDGTVWTAGYGSDGQLADVKFSNSQLLLKRAQTPPGIAKISSGWYHSFALMGAVANAAPVANDDAFTMPEDGALTLVAPGLLANDTDANGDVLSVTSVTAPAHGALVANSDGSFTYTPNANYNGADSFTYTISDGNGGTATATVSVTISPTNDTPVANAQAVSTGEDTALLIVLDGSDIDGDALSFTVTGGPSHGSLGGTAPNLTYTPALNYNGPDSFAFKVNDGTVDSADATVSISVTAVNDGPQLTSPGSKLANELELLAFALSASDADAGDSLAFSIASGTQSGMALDPTTGAFNWTPTEAQGPGSYTVTFRVADAGGSMDEKTISITVNEVNTAPVADGQTVTTAEDMALAIALTASDADLPPNTLAYSVNSEPSHGTLSGIAPNLVYTPAANYNGPDSFTFKVNDDAVDSADATVSINVTAVNDGPELASPGNKVVNELELLSFTLSAAEVDAGDALSFSISSGPQPGMVLDGTTGSFTWMPKEAQAPGSYTVTFRVTDSGSLLDEKTITITVNEVNVAPSITDVPVETTIPELAPFTFDASASDPDAPVQTLTFALIGAPAGATIDAASGIFNWTPTEADGPGDYNFSVRISDGVSTADAPVTLHVTEMNQAPQLTSPSDQIVDEQGALNFILSASDADVPANALSFSIASGMQPGMTLNPVGGVFAWTPTEAQGPASYTVTFRAADADGLFDDMTITITVNEVNTAPVANSQTSSTAEDTSLAIALTGSDMDLPANTLTYSVTGGPSHGSLSGAAPNLIYTPAPDYFGPDSFTFKANDGTVDSAPATVSITVTPVNDNPAANNDSITIDEDSGANVITALANDSILPDVGESLAVIGVGVALHGSVAFTSSSVSYAPDANFFGADSFTYTISDGNGGTATATVSITVNNVNDVPALSLAQPSSSIIYENASVSVAGQVSDADLQDAHTVVIDWNDGSAATTLMLAAGLTEFSASHQYLDDRPSGSPSDVYLIKVTASDVAGAIVTDTTNVTVKNGAPVITSVAGPTGPLPVNSTATVTVNFSDVGTLDTHTVRIAWDDGTPDTALASGGFSRSGSHWFAAAGVYAIAITVTDDDTGEGHTTFDYIVVYDPNGSFVTGGGWIESPAGAYAADLTLSGKANFGFVSKYQKGATIPTGETEFQLHFAMFNFKSTSYQWLVVSGAKAQYKGFGQINGAGSYGFLLTVTDGNLTGGGGVDKFRIKIWEKTTGQAIYDNSVGASEDIDNANPQAIGSGSIVIHNK
jgi:VCBS repeat-containing protein